MTDRRLHDIDESSLENIIRGLPGREPDPGLRAQVLSRSRTHMRRGLPAFRPMLAAALLLLLVIDVIVLKLQDGSVPGAPGRTVVAASSGRAADADTAWLAQMLDEAAPARIAWLRADSASNADTYAALRASLLANGSGG